MAADGEGERGRQGDLESGARKKQHLAEVATGAKRSGPGKFNFQHGIVHLTFFMYVQEKPNMVSFFAGDEYGHLHVVIFFISNFQKSKERYQIMMFIYFVQGCFALSKFG
jgi:hypothetical protein